MEHLELGVEVKDMATQLKGMLTHCQVGTDLSEFYFFQPKGLNPEDGAPLKGLWITGDRIKGAKEVITELPIDMLGSEVIDKASGYKGSVTYLTIHISGCVHAVVQARGCSRKSGQPIEPCDFDIRRLEGKMVPKLTKSERKKEEKFKPSPINLPSCTPIRKM